ncbi:symmetrical bis(5'-nucleosyl)-tetraphosphatase [Acinetobacter sp. B10A]|uniref:symmetrical bis(5'-nucleosyl)-tetraphosphatase n=1 Tax=Acinetobacter baretiae TaxID=2605383 RepID=UPI001B3C9C27|nr:symmetrical bis(5'-nucleosyl)-tetraphosphatase [Acinetobacter baretiae]MBF7686089.1 symmetrical bis(5'-nucleosyl)-tetraphosphatase [Acinetobacter baretiae]
MTGSNYVIGDVQGCYQALLLLLDEIAFDPSQDFLWFTGDLVARGEDSLSALRLIKNMSIQGCAATVLGNHDLTLLACARGFKKINKKDRIDDILSADDAFELIDWLRQQPLFLQLNASTIMTHAGVPHIWSIAQTKAYAHEVERILQSQDWQVVDRFLAQMYRKKPSLWSNDLVAEDRFRVIINYLTRMRLIAHDGTLEFGFKESLSETMPEGFMPWFNYARTDQCPQQIFFGHWAALEGQTHQPHMSNVDGGCVWGNTLIAQRLEDGQVFSVKNPINHTV